MVGDKFHDLYEVVSEVIRRTVALKLNEAEAQDLLKHVLGDDAALVAQGLCYLLVQLRRILLTFQYDNISMQFFLVWAKGVPNANVTTTMLNSAS